MLSQLRQAVPVGCISDLTFDERRAGELDASELAPVEEHLARCERCRQRHERLEAPRRVHQRPEQVAIDLLMRGMAHLTPVSTGT